MIKTLEQINGIRKTCYLIADCFEYLKRNINYFTGPKEVLTTKALEMEIIRFYKNNFPNKEITYAAKDYSLPNVSKPFPDICCISLNEEMCHGMPSADKIIHCGDIIKIDLAIKYNGYYGDACITLPYKDISKDTEKLIYVAQACTEFACMQIKPNKTSGWIGYTANNIAKIAGYSISPNFCGHHVGLEFHEKPDVQPVSEKYSGFTMSSGMVFTVEPIVNQGTNEHRILDDNWTAVTKDGKLSAQFEHTVLVTDTGYEILV